MKPGGIFQVTKVFIRCQAVVVFVLLVGWLRPVIGGGTIGYPTFKNESYRQIGIANTGICQSAFTKTAHKSAFIFIGLLLLPLFQILTDCHKLTTRTKFVAIISLRTWNGVAPHIITNTALPGNGCRPQRVGLFSPLIPAAMWLASSQAQKKLVSVTELPAMRYSRTSKGVAETNLRD